MALIQCKNCGRKISDTHKKCPFCKTPLIDSPQDLTKKERVGAMIIGSVISIGLIIFLMIHFAPTHKKIVFTGTSTKLCSEFKNEIAAHEKYKTGIIEVNGTVSCTGRAMVGGNFVVLQEGTLMPSVYCYFGNKSASDLAKIRKKDKVVIHGEDVLKLLNSVTLSNCTLISHNKKDK